MVKKAITKDKFKEREASLYQHPIPSREYLLAHLKKMGKPLKHEQLAEDLGLESAEELEGLRRRLKAMARDGQVVANRRNAYALPEKMNLIRGRVIGHRDGFGFITPERGGEDIFLTARQMRVLFHGDVVLASIAEIDRRGRLHGDVVEILERQVSKVIGKLHLSEGVAVVQPNNSQICHDILVPGQNLAGARNGHIVVVEIINYPNHKYPAVGQVIEILGEDMAPGMEIDIAIRNHGLPHIWSDPVLAEIEKIPTTVIAADRVGRVDLTEKNFVTIDGDDALDFDDAVYCAPRKSGWHLLVAIADVSHYVMQHTALDEEAYARGNSVYFPDYVIPMLPEALSNGLCSLNPKVERLVLVCDMLITENGKISRFKFYPATICSQQRLTYDNVQHILQAHPKLCQKYQTILPALHNLYAVYHALLQARKVRGAIEFDTAESKIIFGKNRKIDKIIPVQRNEAHRIIEECMLAANVCAAKFLLKHKMQILYRNHAEPSLEKLAKLKNYLAGLGLKLVGGERPTANDFSELMERITQRKDAKIIQMVMLRSLTQAVYQPDNIGHFGLAYTSYSHFTSPIRRYPDLLTHRAIKYIIQGKKSKDFSYTHNQMLQLGEHCSMTERRADDATRDVILWLKCEYMQDRVGQQFSGIVSSVTSFGLFVTLNDVYVDGLLHVTALPNDYYHFDPHSYRLSGERTGKVFRVGDKRSR
jgi:ribonuclease R